MAAWVFVAVDFAAGPHSAYSEARVASVSVVLVVVGFVVAVTVAVVAVELEDGSIVVRTVVFAAVAVVVALAVVLVYMSMGFVVFLVKLLP